MELSIREAATLMGRSPRTVRAQVARGDLPGVKRNGRWRIERRHLPLTEAQRAALQAKADDIRHVVEAALPSRLARSTGQRHRSIADLDAFRRGAELLTEIRGAADDGIDEPLRQRVAGRLEEALLALAEGVQQFDREVKVEALRRSRGHLARAVGLLLLAAGIPPASPAHGWVAALETEVIPAVAGFARWADGLGRKAR